MSFESAMRRFNLRMKKRMYKFDKNRWLAKNQQDLKAFEDRLLHSMLDTLDKVAKGKSLARFGDGEITLMDGDDIDFQQASPELAAELEQILRNEDSRLLVCLPTILKACNAYEENWWLKFWYVRWQDLKHKLNFEQAYGHSMVTRPDFFIMYPEQSIAAWKAIWNQKKTVFITGEGSKLDINHALFDNIAEKKIIYSKACNAYSDLERITAEVEKSSDSAGLILIALGPSGTVLAKRLAGRGIQALDVGHITSSYEEAFHSEAAD